MKGSCFSLLPACLLAAVLCSACGVRKESPAPVPPAWPAGTLHRLGTTQEPPLDLSSLRGTVLLLDFWAPWSAPSNDGLSALRGLQADLAQQSFSVIGMTVAERRTPELDAEVGGLTLNYPVVIADAEARRRHGAERVVPTRVLVGRDGTALRTYRGAVDLNRIRSDVEKALRGEALPPEPARP